MTGSNFDSVTGVTFDGVPALSYSVLSSTRLTAVVPPGSTAGQAYVSVAAAGGTSVALGTYEYIASPEILNDPASTTKERGANAEFSVTATHASEYQWQLSTGGAFANLTNFGNHTGVNTASLGVSSVTMQMSGYRYRVVVGGVGEDAVSEESTLTVTAVRPSEPENVVSVPGDGKITISFDPPVDDGGSAIIGYIANCGTDQHGTSPLTLTDLENGVLHSCTVVAVNEIGPGNAATTSATPRSGDAALSSLSLSDGSLSPVFSSVVTEYTASVAHDVTKVRLQPAAAAGSEILVEGNVVASGSFSGDIPLEDGVNTVEVKVTAQNGVAVRIYRIAVTRLRSNDPSLNELVASAGSISPSFDP